MMIFHDFSELGCFGSETKVVYRCVPQQQQQQQ